MSTAINQLIEAEGLPADYRDIVDRHWRPLSEDIAERYADNLGGKPLVVGINGAQGSGKTTLCRFLEVLLFEGWCLGAVPQDEADLAEPVNALEAAEDPDCVWRRYVNRALREDYAKLFAELDMLIMLKVPDFDTVRRNRALQEDKLRARDPDAPGLMDAAALKRFLDQDERLTLHMFAEMPARADILIEIAPDQRPFG